MMGRIGLLALSAGLACASVTANATEAGNTHADLGFNDTLLGISPPPGIYFRTDTNIIDSGRLNDQSGNQAHLNLGRAQFGLKFRNTVEAQVFEVAYVPDIKVPYINGTIGTAAYIAFANSRAGLSSVIGVPEAHANSKAGFNDPTIVPIFLGFEIPQANLHFILAPFDFNPPIGRYSKSDPIGNNVGLNFWSFRPAFQITYLNKTGQELNLGLNASFNTSNPANGYKSGDEFFFNWSAEQYLSPKLAFGLGGYYYKQTSNDTIHGVSTNRGFDPLNQGIGTRGETFAIGPLLSYNPTSNILLETHWDHELVAYNRSLKDQFWLRGVIRF